MNFHLEFRLSTLSFEGDYYPIYLVQSGKVILLVQVSYFIHLLDWKVKVR